MRRELMAFDAAIRITEISFLCRAGCPLSTSRIRRYLIPVSIFPKRLPDRAKVNPPDEIEIIDAFDFEVRETSRSCRSALCIFGLETSLASRYLRWLTLRDPLREAQHHDLEIEG